MAELVGGAKAIAPPSGPGPIAVPFIIKGEDGALKTVYIDVQTGNIVYNPTGYTIVSSGGNVPNLNAPDLDLSKKSEFTDKTGSLNDSNEQTVAEKILNGNPGEHGALNAGPSSQGNRTSQNPMNNFGYISKNNLVSKALSVIGGAVIGGPAMKAVDIGLNMNNEQAAETARKMLGIDPPSVRQTAKSLWSGNKGQIGTMDIGNKTYNVGFEAVSPDDKTNLTPMEANNRANLAKAQAATKSFAEHAIEKSLGTPSTSPTNQSNTVDSRYGKVPDNVGNSTAKAISRQNSGVTPTSVNTGTTNSQATAPTNKNAVPGNQVGFTANFGPNRPNMPSGGIVGKVREAVGATLGKGYTVKGISGQEDEGHQYGSKRHKTGNALDFDVVDSSGKKVTDVNALSDVAANFAYKNPGAQIGFGKNYMKDEQGQIGRMHFDTTNLGNTDPEHYSSQWGDIATSKALKETLDAARKGYKPTPFSNPPTPTSRPNPTETGAFVSQDERVTPSALDPVGNSLSPTATAQKASATPTAFANIGQNTNKAVSTTTSGVGVIGKAMTPAEAASKGFVTRTAQEKANIARALAGELSPGSLKNLQNKDPEAMKEFSNMMATVENRAASKQFKSVPGTLAPSQYNSLMDANKAVTNANYAKYQKALSKAVDDFYSGQNPPTNPGATNYYNPDVANPGWGQKMTNQTQNGAHLFGQLPGYDPGPDYANSSFGNPKSYLNANTGAFGTRRSPGIGRSSFDTPSNANNNRTNFGNPGSPDDRGGFAANIGASARTTANNNRSNFGNPGSPDDRGGGTSLGGSARSTTTGGGLGVGNTRSGPNAAGAAAANASVGNRSTGGMNTSGAQSGANSGKGKTEKGSSSGGGHWGA